MQRCRWDFSRRVVVSVLAALVLAGCSPDEAGTPSPTPTEAVAPSPTPTPTPDASPTPSPSPSPTPTPDLSPSPTSTLSPEQQAAVEVIDEYFRLQEEVGSDLEADVAELMAIIDGDFRRMVTENLNTVRALGQVSRGSSVHRAWKVEAPSEVSGETQIVVFACLDSTGLETVDAETGEIAAMPPQYLDHRLVVADRDGWKIVTGGNKVVEACP